MHNKFLVFGEQGAPKSVWTGTANVSNHCMGIEKNSNMSIFIDNPSVARAFMDEFNLMFEPKLQPSSKGSKVEFGSNYRVGAFHHTKTPISNRLFKFDDGTYLRVHFAPTDDGEHRSIIPLILSAQVGDTIKVSMFANTGYELVRVLQYAQSKGVNIKLLLDAGQAAGNYSWINNATASLADANPYPSTAMGKLEIKKSAWNGKNHYKAGILLRSNGICEQLILGSQNWSSGGNDENDENMVSIMNKTRGAPGCAAFSEMFDGTKSSSNPNAGKLWAHGGQACSKKSANSSVGLTKCTPKDNNNAASDSVEN
jgi:phosphatidylserine/phosphatidylglycerophosphate/cardiolipin synthase-like enzyme